MREDERKSFCRLTFGDGADCCWMKTQRDLPGILQSKANEIFNFGMALSTFQLELVMRYQEFIDAFYSIIRL